MNNPKYRAYNKQLKKMMPVLEINLDPEFGGVFVWGKAYYDADTGEHEADKDFWAWDDIELMPFTGYKDRHDKEIYQSDRVRIENDTEPKIVTWGTFSDCCVQGETWLVYPDCYQPTLYYYVQELEVEIIGNIWQQPTE